MKSILITITVVTIIVLGSTHIYENESEDIAIDNKNNDLVISIEVDLRGVLEGDFNKNWYEHMNEKYGNNWEDILDYKYGDEWEYKFSKLYLNYTDESTYKNIDSYKMWI